MSENSTYLPEKSLETQRDIAQPTPNATVPISRNLLKKKKKKKKGRKKKQAEYSHSSTPTTADSDDREPGPVKRE